MPFKSKAQRRACYAVHDPNWNCGEWESHTKGKLPERVTKKESYSFADWFQAREINEDWRSYVAGPLALAGAAFGASGMPAHATERPAAVAQMSKPDISQATKTKDYYDSTLGDVKAHFMPDGKIIHVDKNNDYWQKKFGNFGTVYSKWQNGKWSQWIKNPKTLK